MKTKVREKANWPVTILLILGLITVVFPLYMTIVIAFKQPTEMTNSVAGILSLPEKFSLANFREAMEVTDFWLSWKQCIDHCDHSGSCYCNSFTFRLCYSQKQEK